MKARSVIPTTSLYLFANEKLSWIFSRSLKIIDLNEKALFVMELRKLHWSYVLIPAQWRSCIEMNLRVLALR